tara:strand:- start:1272 stop:1472 length:201 start_codon:yes stop_codon:yes gene_type:complete
MNEDVFSCKVNGAVKGNISYTALTYLHAYAVRNHLPSSTIMNQLNWVEGIDLRKVKEQLNAGKDEE